MEKTFKLENVNAYKISRELANFNYQLVNTWDWFNKRTIGVQLQTAIDSIAGNIAEGFGRYHKKDKIKFYYNARASVFETAHWIRQAYSRNLINEKDYYYIIEKLRILPKEINTLISLTDKNLKE